MSAWTRRHTDGKAVAATVVGARSGAHSFLYARAATWIDGTMLRADQVPLSKAESAEASVARYCCLE
jgi:hypothetical protein